MIKPVPRYRVKLLHLFCLLLRVPTSRFSGAFCNVESFLRFQLARKEHNASFISDKIVLSFRIAVQRYEDIPILQYVLPENHESKRKKGGKSILVKMQSSRKGGEKAKKQVTKEAKKMAMPFVKTAMPFCEMAMRFLKMAMPFFTTAMRFFCIPTANKKNLLINPLFLWREMGRWGGQDNLFTTYDIQALLHF